MKKILVALTILLMAADLCARPVSSTQAEKVASTAARLFLFELKGEKTPIDADVQWMLQDVTEEVAVSNIYVYNYYMSTKEAGHLGFVVVSGDDIASPVLAFSMEGTLDKDNLNPAVRCQLQQYGREIAAARAAGISSTKAIEQKWTLLESGEAYERALRNDAKGDIYHDDIQQLLGGMQWGQGMPYNDLCPGGSVTGCVATALGMIMNYWDYPEHGFGQHSYNGANNPAAYPNWHYGEQFADYEHTYYDWANMNDYAYANSPDSVKVAISTLLYHVGVALDMNYSPSGSGSWSLPEYAIFDTSLHLDATYGADYRIPKHFGYKFSYAGMRDSIGNDSVWMTMLYESLRDGKPIYYAGWAYENNEAGHSGTNGHGYVIDGYFSDEIDSNMFHLNWGWSGSSNGYFKLDAMRPSGMDFTKWHGAIIGLEPDTSYHGYDPAGIRSVEFSNAQVFAQDKNIVVRGIEGQDVGVYDLMGRCVATRSQQRAVEWSVPVRAGIYVVRVGLSAAQKVIVL